MKSFARVGLSAAFALVCAGAATAEPDIIYGNIEDTAQYGPVAGVRAYMFGTYTCNRGNSNAMWNSNATPGVGFNAYRLYDGRLQQIGMSWVKTACCAGVVNDPANCGGLAGCNGVGGSFLGAGCRDYYWASYNANQGSLSPRSGINAFTGQFPSIPPASFNAIDRRLQIPESAMNPTAYPGALYFVEGVYVATDETSDNAKSNNCSYRRATFTGASYSVALQGSTVIGEPAIKAWRLNGLGANQPDSRVSDGTVSVPGEGRFHYAAKVTDLGGGNYRYDYAVFNQNSHRSARGLRIPVPASAQINNIGFSDVAYNSGEPFSSTDWTGQKVGAEVIWQTDTFAANPNANALRWGTMYNFWFETNVPPATGAATLDLFRTGTPTNVQFMVTIPQGEPPCVADFNGSGGATVQDIYDFLSQWNARNPATDINGVGGVTVQDIYDFLSAWNAGCP